MFKCRVKLLCLFLKSVMINKDNKKGLYIHIPYCKQKCLYCSFYSLPSVSVDDAYIDALIREIEQYKDKKYVIDTVFIGGGTPSLLNESQIERIFGAINNTFRLDAEEVTVEMNPDSITPSKLSIFKKCGVNRISIGVQSFNDKELRAIGRIHNSLQAQKAIELAKKFFNNINIDLMVGIPSQSSNSIFYNVSTAVKLGVTHISVYSLILEEDTPLYDMVNAGLSIPDEDETVDFYDLAVNELVLAGFERYEISNFAREGYRCRHNLHCWQFREYIGIGPSASSFLEGKRYTNEADICSYISRGAKPIEQSSDEPYKEYIMLALRTKDGVDKRYFEEKFSLSFDEMFKDILKEKIIIDCFVNADDSFYIRPEYIYISNSIIVEFF